MKRVLVIGVGGLDWAGLTSRLRAGRLPGLAALQARGALAPLPSPVAEPLPSAWASLASGQPAYAHQVVMAEEPWAGGLRPVGSASWREPPVWAWLEAAGVSTGSVAWPATRPGALWPGAHLDDSYAEPSGRNGDSWTLPLGCAPRHLREAVRALRVHPADISLPMLQPFVADAAEIEQSRDTVLPRLAIALAEAASVQAGAAWLLQEHRPQATFVHQPLIARILREFGSKSDERSNSAVEGSWRFVDAAVARLSQMAGAETNLLIVSPGRLGRAGAVIAAGPGLEGTRSLAGFNLLDLAPSVLALFGLTATGLPGRNRSSIATDAMQPVSRPDSPSPSEANLSLIAAAQASGFTLPPSQAERWRAAHLTALASSALQPEPSRALGLAQEALKLQPGYVDALRIAATAHAMLEEVEALPDLADALERAAPGRGWAALARGAFYVAREQLSQARPWLLQAEADPDPETLVNVAGVWLAAARHMDAERVFKRILTLVPDHAGAEIGKALAAMARHDFLQGEAALRRALQIDPSRPAAYLQLANLHARTGRRTEAQAFAAQAQTLGADPAAASAAAQGAA